MFDQDANRPGIGVIAAESLREQTGEQTEAYHSREPFPWVTIDDFMSAELTEALLLQASNDDSSKRSINTAHEHLTTYMHPETMGKLPRSVFHALCAPPFIKLLENITGIEGLIPDPDFSEAGLFETKVGGYLSIHADGNYHRRLKLERRVSVLIYLNKDWREEYGGQLEFWDSRMSRLAQSILPTFNRAVIFSSGQGQMHGNPNPIAHPEGVPGRSISVHYYTATWDDTKRAREAVPGSSEQFRQI